MPSGMLEAREPAITRGMNTVDDPKRLSNKECVRLLNAYPGNPPRPINGSTGKLLSGTSMYRFVPPGIAFEYGGNTYIVVWAYRAEITTYTLMAILSSGASKTNLVVAGPTVVTNVFLDFISLHGYIYCAATPIFMNLTNPDAVGLKVVESNTVLRDMCIADGGAVNAIALGVNGGVFVAGASNWLEYAFQYVRRNDTDAFENGTTPIPMILPPNITASYQPKRMDTFLPGVCIGVETVANRKTLEISTQAAGLTAGMISHSGFGAFSAAQCIDGNTATVGFNVDAAASGAYLKIDFGSGQTRNITQVGFYMGGAGSTATFKIRWSDDDATYTDAVASWAPSADTWNNQDVVSVLPHRYWKIELTNTPGAGPDIMEVRAYSKACVAIDISNMHISAMEQGATHLRVSRTRLQSSEVNAQGATKSWVVDLPIGVTTTSFNDTVSDAAFEGTFDDYPLLTGYSVAPIAGFIEYVKGRVFLMGSDGRVYYSEVIGGGGYDLELAQAYPKPWASLFKPYEYYIDCDYIDGQKAMGTKRLGDDLYFFKERKTFALYGGDPTAAARSLVSSRVGCAFPYTLTVAEIKGVFGNCILFLSNEGPMILREGGSLRPFSEFKIKYLWPDREVELYSELENHFQWIIENCTAAYFKNVWWIMYRTYGTDGTDGENRMFGYYFDPSLAAGREEPQGPFEFEFAGL